MAYNPNIYSPYNSWNQFASPAQPVRQMNSVVYINDVNEAVEYQLPPNSISPLLMLKSKNVFLTKDSDGTLNAFQFEEVPLSSLINSDSDYVTKADFEAFTEQIMEAINGKHSVPTQSKPNKEEK